MALFRELLNIPDNYKILFLGGGASTQFFEVPYNFLEKKAGYVNTGVWAKKAIKEAKNFGEVQDMRSRPIWITCTLRPNNTIYGTEYHTDIDSPVPVIADMSSDILSRPVGRFEIGMIYGGAQKNIGPAGVTFVIVREDLLGKVSRPLPSMVDYRNHIANDSMFNTPPVFAIYVVKETLKWLKSIGGVKEIQKRNGAKLSCCTTRSTTARYSSEKYADRLPNSSNSPKAKAWSASRDTVWGRFRASIYNALPIESVQALADKADLLAAVKDADGLIIRSDKVTAEVVAAAEKLKIVVRAGA
ncbi:unnamed protein product, partial [Mycena citricolor]